MKVIDICLGVYLRGFLLIFAPFCLASDSAEGVWGIQEVSTGGMLEGIWVDEKAHGRMTYIMNGYKLYYFFDHGNNLGSSEYYYDLDNYAGGFDNYGRRSGFGAFDYEPDADELYVGEWKRDEPHGIGIYFFLGGNAYMGLFEDNIRKGRFLVVMPDGTARETIFDEDGLGAGIVVNENDSFYKVGMGSSTIEYDGSIVVYRNEIETCIYDFKKIECDTVDDQ